MSKIKRVSKICACCGKESKQIEYLSKFMINESLDGRDDDSLELHTCPHCNYINTDISQLISEKTLSIVNSDEYKSLVTEEMNFNDLSELAKKFSSPESTMKNWLTDIYNNIKNWKMFLMLNDELSIKQAGYFPTKFYILLKLYFCYSDIYVVTDNEKDKTIALEYLNQAINIGLLQQDNEDDEDIIDISQALILLDCMRQAELWEESLDLIMTLEQLIIADGILEYSKEYIILLYERKLIKAHDNTVQSIHNIRLD